MSAPALPSHGALFLCLSVQVRQLIFQAPLQLVMQADVDGQGRGLRQLLLRLPEHLYGADVLAVAVMLSCRTRAQYGLPADLDLVNRAVAAGARNAVELVLVQAEDLDALAKSAEPGYGAGFLGGLSCGCHGVPPLSLL